MALGPLFGGYGLDSGTKQLLIALTAGLYQIDDKICARHPLTLPPT
jgi:hypothetical protein